MKFCVSGFGFCWDVVKFGNHDPDPDAGQYEESCDSDEEPECVDAGIVLLCIERE
jgi:hypothetical protein